MARKQEPIDPEALAREVDDRLRKPGTEERRAFIARSAPTSMETIGVVVPLLRPISKDVAKRVKSAAPEVVLELVEHLIDGGTFEGRQVAYEVLGGHRKTLFSLDEEQVLELGREIDNWGSVDTFAGLIAGPAWREGQISDDVIVGWTQSEDRWWRRAAIVCTVALNQKARGGRGDTPRTMMICELLVADHDDMVVKALSWALRELAKREPGPVLDFLVEYEDHLAARVKREVRNKLKTGLKTPK